MEYKKISIWEYQVGEQTIKFKISSSNVSNLVIILELGYLTFYCKRNIVDFLRNCLHGQPLSVGRFSGNVHAEWKDMQERLPYEILWEVIKDQGMYNLLPEDK